MNQFKSNCKFEKYMVKGGNKNSKSKILCSYHIFAKSVLGSPTDLQSDFDELRPRQFTQTVPENLGANSLVPSTLESRIKTLERD